MYEPEIRIISPKLLIPMHNADSTLYWKTLYRVGLYDFIPNVPLIQAPDNMRYLGDYINYNGHHRTKSALELGVNIRAYIIKTDDDIKFLEDNCEIYEELIEGLGTNFKEHYNHVYMEAQRYHSLRQLATIKGINL